MVASTMAYSMSGSSETASNRRFHTSAFTQSRKRVYTLIQRPKARGRSRHGLPVRAIHNTASTNSRLSLPLRPGQPMSGKTHAALSAAFTETRKRWLALGRAPDDPQFDRSVPWIYVEVPKNARGLSVLKPIWTFLGLPPLPSRPTTADYLQALRRIAPRIGLRGIIIDDGHGVGGHQSEESRLLADLLKTIITGLPVTIVLVGTGFNESGVLRGSAGDQVRLRGARWIDVGLWDAPARGEVGEWELLGRHLTERLLLPSEGARVRFTNRRVLDRLAYGSDLRPGLAVVWAKRAASYAVWNDTDLDLTALDATHAELRSLDGS